MMLDDEEQTESEQDIANNFSKELANIGSNIYQNE